MTALLSPYEQAKRRMPRTGDGAHPHLLTIANLGLREGVPPEQIEADMAAAWHGERPPSATEFRDAIRKAQITAPPSRPSAALAQDATGFPSIVRADEFTAAPCPAPPEVVHGVLHRGSKMVYGGPSKAFKSWTLMDLCLAVALGLDWFGFPTTPGLVLYVNLELQAFAVHRRLQAIAAARGVAVPSTLRIWNLRGTLAALPDLLPELLRQIEGESYTLIVPDPIYKCLGGRDENSAGDMGQLMAELEAVAIQTGAAIAFGAHFAKGNASGKEHIDRVSGSGVFARDPDTIATATTHEEPGAFSVEMTCRNFPPPEPFAIRWKYPRMMRDAALDPARLRQVRRQTGPLRPDIETLVPAAVALMTKLMNPGVYRGKLHKLAGTQTRGRELFNVLVGDGHLVESHERGRGKHDALIGTPAQIEAHKQRKLKV